jgi:hypothetical protein
LKELVLSWRLPKFHQEFEFQMSNFLKVFGLFLFVSACSTSNTSDLEGRFERMDTGLLWLEQSTTQSFVELAHVEVELVSRGETKRGPDYIGKRTSTSIGKRLFQRIQGGGDIYNCADFASSFAAQKFFLETGGPSQDPNNLDSDGDGLACEWGTTVRQYARANRPKPIAQPRRTTRPRRVYSNCYTGPRGGTYTITASGRKNYGGC